MTTEQRERLVASLSAMQPITLKDMKSIRLMNRTDRKYVTNVEGLLALLQLTHGSYYAQEVEGKRISAYRTVYWDAPGYPFFQRHQNGRLPRTKVRARTYVDSNLSFLEVKQKNNHGKTHKERMKVDSIDCVMNDGVGADYVKETCGHDMGTLFPTVGNHFHRLTLVNHAKTERLTIDFDLQFDNIENGREKELDNIVVIELKRDGRVFSPVLAMLRELRIKPCGFSKYCMGMCYTAEGIRINRFKERLRRIERIARN
ncbi:MAG: polyphosphate polymerase domain-containing protein [Alloprevotella sp.]|nr:polyphosphate polymerase domain-containing protein [Alloprevotella sp.]